jgi:uncharacterized protein
VEKQVQELLRQLHQDQWKPDYVVGLTRGGLVPANLMSQYLGVPMETLKVSLRDDTSLPETNCWMPEDAIGYECSEESQGCYLQARKNILVVDDINDSGATLNWIKQDWESSVAGVADSELWDSVWNNNVRVAVLYDNEASSCVLPISYSAVDINKAEEDQWIVFPWEEWWK